MKVRSAIKKILFRTAPSLIVGFLLFLLIKPYIVEAAAGDEDMSIYLAAENLEVGTKKDKRNINQIKYVYKGKEVVVTEEGYAHADPVTDGEFIVWTAQVDGYWQIFIHNVTTNNTSQLTYVGNNVSPAISGDRVVWEGQVDGVWQIMLFDGIRVRQLTEGELPSLSPDIDINYLVYASMIESGGNYRVYLRDLKSEILTLLTPKDYGWNPDVSGEFVFWYGSLDREEVAYMYLVPTGEVLRASVADYLAYQQNAFTEFVTSINVAGLSDSLGFGTEPVEEFTPISDEVDILPPEETPESTGADSLKSADTNDAIKQVSKDEIIEELAELNSQVLESTSSYQTN